MDTGGHVTTLLRDAALKVLHVIPESVLWTSTHTQLGNGRYQGQIQEFALGASPLPRFSPLLFRLEVGSPLNHLGVLGERCKLPQRGPGQSPD